MQGTLRIRPRVIPNLLPAAPRLHLAAAVEARGEGAIEVAVAQPLAHRGIEQLRPAGPGQA